jgi:hypothetical protein
MTPAEARQGVGPPKGPESAKKPPASFLEAPAARRRGLNALTVAALAFLVASFSLTLALMIDRNHGALAP